MISGKTFLEASTLTSSGGELKGLNFSHPALLYKSLFDVQKSFKVTILKTGYIKLPNIHRTLMELTWTSLSTTMTALLTLMIISPSSSSKRRPARFTSQIDSTANTTRVAPIPDVAYIACVGLSPTSSNINEE